MENKVLYVSVVMLMHLMGSGFSHVGIISGEGQWKLVMAEPKRPIMVTVTSPTCGLPCAILDDQIAQLAKIFGEEVLFYTIDILKMPFFAKLYAIINIPTLINFQCGVEIDRLEDDFQWDNIYGIINASVFSPDFALPPADFAQPPSDFASPGPSPWGG